MNFNVQIMVMADYYDDRSIAFFCMFVCVHF